MSAFCLVETLNKRKQSIKLLPLFLAECSSPVLIRLPSFEILVPWQSCKKLQVYGDQAFDSTTNLQQKNSAKISLLGTSHEFSCAYNRKIGHLATAHGNNSITQKEFFCFSEKGALLYL